MSTVKKTRQKLKDSCDGCSSFKLRCDKQKPTCTRCLDLNRSCTYSPARRAGRPHAVRRESNRSQSQIQVQAQTQTQPQPQRRVDQSQNSLSQNQGRGEDLLQWFESSNPSDPVALSRTMGSLPMPTDDAMDMGMSTFPEAYLNPGIGSVPSYPPSASDPSHADTTSEPDSCITVALSIVEQLETSKRQVGTFGSSNGSLTSTDACQRLLAILVCPCSEQAEVALLAASACISLLDSVHSSTSASSSRASTSTTPVSRASTSATAGSHAFSEQDLLLRRPEPPSSRGTLTGDSPSSQVGDLVKIAKVILEFTDRYCQENNGDPRWKHTTWAMAPVVALLRCALQSVTQGTTRRLVT